MRRARSIPLQEPYAGNPPVRFDERDVETERFAPPCLDSTRDRITRSSQRYKRRRWIGLEREQGCVV